MSMMSPIVSAAYLAAAETYLIEVLSEGQVWSAEEAVACNRDQVGGGGRCDAHVQSLYVVCAA